MFSSGTFYSPCLEFCRDLKILKMLSIKFWHLELNFNVMQKMVGTHSFLSIHKG